MEIDTIFLDYPCNFSNFPGDFSFKLDWKTRGKFTQGSAECRGLIRFTLGITLAGEKKTSENWHDELKGDPNFKITSIFYGGFDSFNWIKKPRPLLMTNFSKLTIFSIKKFFFGHFWNFFDRNPHFLEGTCALIQNFC